MESNATEQRKAKTEPVAGVLPANSKLGDNGMGRKDGNRKAANPSKSSLILQKNDRDTNSILLKDLEVPPLSAPLPEASREHKGHKKPYFISLKKCRSCRLWDTTTVVHTMPFG